MANLGYFGKLSVVMDGYKVGVIMGKLTYKNTLKMIY
ncbi:hypothetical protein E9Q_05943 [Moraxella catarrhalis BC1]|nr:hypothetical protein E9Q_05943 [Moraxella catarrhalis BC1]